MVCDIDAIRPVRQQGMPGAESGLDSVVPFDNQLGLVRKTLRLERVVKTLPALLRIADF